MSTFSQIIAPSSSDIRAVRFARNMVIRQLKQISRGHLEIHDSLGITHFGTGEHYARIDVTDLNFYWRVLTGGSLGAADGFIEGEWTTPDLVAIVRLFALHRDVLDQMEGGFALLKQAIAKIIHACKRNTKSGSKKNIHAHYDLGNTFFASFLDKEMMYSSALFSDTNRDLELASKAKIEKIIDLLEIKRHHRVLEIGSGWGGLAIAIAKSRQCHVTTITVSKEQYNYVKQRIQDEDLDALVSVEFKDYRDINGTFDRIVSVEMIEAVGHQYLPTFFDICSKALKPGGILLMQAITIEEHRYLQARDSVDFIKQYIFPGSFIPCNSVLIGAAAKYGKLQLTYANDFGDSYAKTCGAWRNRFLAAKETSQLDDRFVRLWEFYLAYCEGGFMEKAIGVSHLRWSKSQLS